MPQALAAADLARRLGITLHAAVYLQVPEGELVSRLLSRAQLEERRDDMPEVIRRRLRIFSEQTAPLVDYYRDRGILLTVEGNQSPDDVTATILRGLKELAPGSEQPPP
jgi:adenylate kinase